MSLVLTLPDPNVGIENSLPFSRIARPLQRRLQRDLLLEIGRGQRLIKRLHAELILTGLHGRIDLVNLVLANQIADRGVGDEDFHDHGASLAVYGLQQALAHDAFQHQGKLSANLGLLVCGKHVDDAVDGGCGRIGVQSAEG